MFTGEHLSATDDVQEGRIVGTRWHAAGMTASTTLDGTLLAEMLGRQHDVITRQQAITCGMSRQALRHRVRPGGPWRRLLPGVYVARTGTPTRDQRDMAALLYAGPGSVITGCAALKQLGIQAPSTPYVDVLVPVSKRRQSVEFVRVQRTRRIPERVCITGRIQFTLPARAVADAARGLPGIREVRSVVAGSVQQGRCRVSELASELADGPRAGSAEFRRVLAEVATGIRSVAEAEFRKLLQRSGLPMPMFNARLYSGDVLFAIADAWWPDAGVAAEVDSREWHLSPEDWEKTMRRHARMTAEGILVLHFSPKQIRSQPAELITTLRAALDVRRTGAQARVRTLPAPG
jgi:hypothetical protein